VEERSNYETRDNNRFALSLAEVSKYRRFLSIILGRYQTASQEVASQIKRLTSLASGEATTIESAVLVEFEEMNTRLHLEIESFYVFAKILLNKIALFIQYYFGQAHSCSLASHHKFTKCYERYGELQGLVYPEGLSQSLVFLQEKVCNFRDKQISHLQNFRAMKATTFGLSDMGNLRLGVAGYLYPRDGELERLPDVSMSLPELLDAVDTYIEQVIELVKTNRDKTCFTLAG
jgi:hypothetical protein